MNDEARIVLAYAVAALLYAAYLLGFHRGRQPALPDPKFGLRWRGVARSVAIPVLFLVMYFGLAAHLRLALGRWPVSIGDNPDSWWLQLHAQGTWRFAVAIACSLVILPAGFLVCLAVRRWLPLAAYLACYAAAVLAGFGLMHVAPASFVGWFWD
jgi:hypothetical protein